MRIRQLLTILAVAALSAAFISAASAATHRKVTPKHHKATPQSPRKAVDQAFVHYFEALSSDNAQGVCAATTASWHKALITQIANDIQGTGLALPTTCLEAETYVTDTTPFHVLTASYVAQITRTIDKYSYVLKNHSTAILHGDLQLVLQNKHWLFNAYI